MGNLAAEGADFPVDPVLGNCASCEVVRGDLAWADAREEMAARLDAAADYVAANPGEEPVDDELVCKAWEVAGDSRKAALLVRDGVAAYCQGCPGPKRVLRRVDGLPAGIGGYVCGRRRPSRTVGSQS